MKGIMRTFLICLLFVLVPNVSRVYSFQATFRVYTFPTIANQMFTIAIRNFDRAPSDSLDISVYHISGVLFWHTQEPLLKSLGDNDITINCSSWPIGPYFCHITNGIGRETIKMAIVR